MTDKTPWTPWPWGLRCGIEIWVMAGDLHVATIPRSADGDWSPQNAHLIVAAPKMANVLQDALDWFEIEFEGAAEHYHEERKIMQGIRAALAEARGEK